MRSSLLELFFGAKQRLLEWALPKKASGRWGDKNMERVSICEITGDIFCKTGELLTERQDNLVDKVVGGVQIVLGGEGYVVSKMIHKAQSPVRHWINKKTGMNPIGDCLKDCKYILQEGLDRFK